MSKKLICNRCGQSCDFPPNDEDTPWMPDGWEHLTEMEVDLCEPCVRGLNMFLDGQTVPRLVKNGTL